MLDGQGGLRQAGSLRSAIDNETRPTCGWSTWEGKQRKGRSPAAMTRVHPTADPGMGDATAITGRPSKKRSQPNGHVLISPQLLELRHSRPADDVVAADVHGCPRVAHDKRRHGLPGPHHRAPRDRADPGGLLREQTLHCDCRQVFSLSRTAACGVPAAGSTQTVGHCRRHDCAAVRVQVAGAHPSRSVPRQRGGGPRSGAPPAHACGSPVRTAAVG